MIDILSSASFKLVYWSWVSHPGSEIEIYTMIRSYGRPQQRRITFEVLPSSSNHQPVQRNKGKATVTGSIIVLGNIFNPERLSHIDDARKHKIAGKIPR